MLQGEQVAWVALVPTHLEMHVYDLAQHTQRTLNLPSIHGVPRDWNIFGNVMLWQDSFYQGYDLERDAYFSIPVIPPGWENKLIQDVGPVKADGGKVYWSLEVDGQTYYFSAPLVAKDQR